MDGVQTKAPRTATLHHETLDEMQELIRAYAANPPFRSATADELVVTDNPFRRPIRPPDLDFVEYRQPLRANEVLKLSALMGHRMLRNIYETEMLYIPSSAASAAWDDFYLFYSPDNIRLGERVRPHLEQHVFDFLFTESAVHAPDSSAALRESILQDSATAHTRLAKIADIITHANDPKRLATTYVIQQLSAYRTEHETLIRAALGENSGVAKQLTHPQTQENWVSNRSLLLKQLVSSCGLHTEPHAYWQFYLSTSSALANYMYHVSREPGNIFRTIGARVYREVHFAANREQLAEMIRAIFGAEADVQYFTMPALTAEQTLESMVTPLVNAFGDRVLDGIARGYYENRRLHEIADENLITQITWADQPDVYVERARIMYDAIKNQNLQVPLDTFVELSSETSTTHTHDEHRLLVIETGEMDFWSLYGPPTHFRPGDITYIPNERLHGSTVTSDECIYHQPVISEELLLEFAKLFPR